MRYLLCFALLLILTIDVKAQCGSTRCFALQTYTSQSNRTSFIVNTGFSDVSCVNGLCYAPVNTGYGYSEVVLPQSTAFFAFSNPQTIEFRVRQFVGTPYSNALFSTDQFGNQVIINAGIQTTSFQRSRGQLLFSH